MVRVCVCVYLHVYILLSLYIMFEHSQWAVFISVCATVHTAGNGLASVLVAQSLYTFICMPFIISSSKRGESYKKHIHSPERIFQHNTLHFVYSFSSTELEIVVEVCVLIFCVPLITVGCLGYFRLYFTLATWLLGVQLWVFYVVSLSLWHSAPTTILVTVHHSNLSFTEFFQCVLYWEVYNDVLLHCVTL